MAHVSISVFKWLGAGIFRRSFWSDIIANQSPMGPYSIGRTGKFWRRWQPGKPGLPRVAYFFTQDGTRNSPVANFGG